MNHCCNDGTLVDATAPFPDDVADYHAHPALGLVGCNRLHCARCFEYVRSAPGVGFALPDMEVDLDALFEREELLGGPEIMRTHEARRLYLCRCSRWLEAFSRPVRIADPDPLTDPTMPWACGGHPLMRLPNELDGVFVRDAAEVAELARRAVSDGFAGPEARPRAAAAWTARLYARLRGTEAADVVAEIAADGLDAADAAARARALRFFAIFPLAVGVARVVDAIARGGAPDETEAAARWAVAAPFVGRNERVRELARRDVLAGRRAPELVAALEREDGAWLGEALRRSR